MLSDQTRTERNVLHSCWSFNKDFILVSPLVADLDAQTILAKAIQEGRLEQLEQVSVSIRLSLLCTFTKCESRLLLHHWGTKVTWCEFWSLWHLGWFWPFLCPTPLISNFWGGAKEKGQKYKKAIRQIIKKTRNMLLIQQWHQPSLRICDIFALSPDFLDEECKHETMIAQVLKDEANKDLLFEDICKEKLVDICNGSLSSEVEVVSPLDLAAVCGREEILQVESQKAQKLCKTWCSGRRGSREHKSKQDGSLPPAQQALPPCQGAG